MKSRELAEAMMDCYLLEEAESSDRALAGSKSFLAKYTRFRSLYMEIIQKLVAVALVSVVGSEDGLQLTLAITLLMAAASGMIQPFLQPQAGCFAETAEGESTSLFSMSAGQHSSVWLLHLPRCGGGELQFP